MCQPKLFMFLLGSKAPGRHVEQHDYFFAIGNSTKELIPEIKAFWPEPEAGDKVHIDAWREVKSVEGYLVKVAEKTEKLAGNTHEENLKHKKLFFINLGGYQAGKFEEQHFAILTVKSDQASAYKEAKETLFFKNNWFGGARSHIDDKYGVDVDDLYQIEDILTPDQRSRYAIELIPMQNLPEDEIHLGYFKLDNF